MKKLVKESLFKLNENTTEHFKYRNTPNEKIERAKEWIRNNPELARMSEKDQDFFEINVFAGNNHKKIANDLYKSLKDSGFLDKYPLFEIRIDPM
jgi:hypothetical protein